MSPTLPHVRTRLSDLAAQAGVSTATVSRVLNGKPGVASETRQAVLAALDVLGYERPSTLRTGTTPANVPVTNASCAL